MATDNRLEHPENAFEPMDFTLVGIVIDGSSRQSENIEAGIDFQFPINVTFVICAHENTEDICVTPGLIATEVKFLHPPNADEPTLVTDAGISISVKLPQSRNASLPILVTPSGTFISDKLLQP